MCVVKNGPLENRRTAVQYLYMLNSTCAVLHVQAHVPVLHFNQCTLVPSPQGCTVYDCTVYSIILYLYTLLYLYMYSVHCMLRNVASKIQ